MAVTPAESRFHSYCTPKDPGEGDEVVDEMEWRCKTVGREGIKTMESNRQVGLSRRGMTL